ncbi:MAG: ABC transporter ATP-binding protein [Nanoarchaeota archaeon]|nr:ABC transporter ATP-binding protein [Nanoarchaeota archaeon]
MVVLEVDNISKSFNLENKKIDVLKNISLKVNKGEFVVINGESGSGKSTFLSIIAGLDKPNKGSIKLLNNDITNFDEDKLAKIRNKDIGFVFQSFYLIPSLTAYENIIFPAQLAKVNAIKLAETLLEKVGVKNRMNSYPIQLSGGEKQRVAIARALINKPKILFADEPTGNLDSKNSENIINLLISLQKEYDLTLIIVTHEKKVSEKASRLIEIKDGKIISDKKQNDKS